MRPRRLRAKHAILGRFRQMPQFALRGWYVEFALFGRRLFVHRVLAHSGGFCATTVVEVYCVTTIRVNTFPGLSLTLHELRHGVVRGGSGAREGDEQKDGENLHSCRRCRVVPM